jgi:phosphoribosylanthranilate isomerase
MAPTRIKICGITRPQDAHAAARAGAHAIGINFYPKARRHVTVDQASEILRILPPFVTPIGLFVDQSIDEVKEIANKLGLNCIQLHGHETPEFVSELRHFKVLKALRADRTKLQQDLQTWRAAINSLDLQHLQGIVLETPAEKAEMGGSGIENDWQFLATLRQTGAFAGLPPIIAAGGLTPQNVAAVIKLLHPYAVDVSTGVEEQFAQKSPAKIEAFIHQVQQLTTDN